MARRCGFTAASTGAVDVPKLATRERSAREGYFASLEGRDDIEKARRLPRLVASRLGQRDQYARLLELFDALIDRGLRTARRGGGNRRGDHRVCRKDVDDRPSCCTATRRGRRGRESFAPILQELFDHADVFSCEM